MEILILESLKNAYFTFKNINVIRAPYQVRGSNDNLLNILIYRPGSGASKDLIEISLTFSADMLFYLVI